MTDLDPQRASALVDARLAAHYAAQVASAFGATHLTSEGTPADVAHHNANLGWSDAHGALVGRTVGGLAAGLRIADLTWLLLSADEVISSLPCAGQTLAQGLVWLQRQAAAHGLPDRPLVTMGYDLPPHPVTSGTPLPDVDATDLEQLSAWFAMSSRALEGVRAAYNGASEVRCWPHHFDIATLVTITAHADPEHARTVGVGMTPGDDGIAAPYFYVTPWPYPDPRRGPALPCGRWNVEGWFGAVLPGSEIHEGAVDAFLASALPAAIEMASAPVLPCGLRLQARTSLAPLTNLQSQPDGTLGEDEFQWLMRRASGGFRFISTCAAFVSEQGHAWRGQLGIASDAHLPGLTRLATGLRERSALAVVQLHHGGVQAKLAPDPISTGGPKDARAATIDDLQQVIADFVAAAQRAERAGFHGVEIHGANGYLFTQFLAPADNPRTDAYGGDLTGRARLLRQAVRAVRAAVSPAFAVGVRLSPVDTWDRRGLVLADGLQVGRWMAEDGVDFVHLSLRDAAGPPPFEPEAGPVARAFRDALPPSVALFAAGGIWTREDAQRAHDAGVDVVVLGRVAIGNPDWPRLSLQPAWSPLRPPWDPGHLRSVAVGEALLEYIKRFPGLVVGGTPAR